MIAIELKGRKALVTGKDSGLGAATVKSLAQAGADVAISYRYASDAADRVRSPTAASEHSGLQNLDWAE